MVGIGIDAPFGAANAAFKAIEFALALKDVEPQNKIFVDLIDVILDDVKEIRRLLKTKSVMSVMVALPKQLEYIVTSVQSATDAINDAGLCVERVRADSDRDGHVAMENRLRWVLRDHGKMRSHQSLLDGCHVKLVTILGSLHQIETSAVTSTSTTQMHQTPETPPPYSEAGRDYLSPAQGRLRAVPLKAKQLSTISMGATAVKVSESTPETTLLTPTAITDEQTDQYSTTSGEILECSVPGTLQLVSKSIKNAYHFETVREVTPGLSSSRSTRRRAMMEAA